MSYQNQFPVYNMAPQRQATFYTLDNETKKIINEQYNKTLSLNPTPLEVAISKCEHRNPDGTHKGVPQADGKFECPSCHERYNIVDSSRAEVEAVVEKLCDILNTEKVFYLDAPPAFYTEYMAILMPLLKKTGALYEMAMNSYSKYEPNSYNMNYGGNAFAMLGSISSGAYGFNPYQQMGGMQMQNPAMGGMYPQQMGGMYPQQMGGMQMQNPAMGGMYPQQMGGNPFFNGGDPTMQMQQQPMQMQQQPMQQQPVMQQQPQPAADPTKLESTKVFQS